MRKTCRRRDSRPSGPPRTASLPSTGTCTRLTPVDTPFPLVSTSLHPQRPTTVSWKTWMKSNQLVGGLHSVGGWSMFSWWVVYVQLVGGLYSVGGWSTFSWWVVYGQLIGGLRFVGGWSMVSWWVVYVQLVGGLRPVGGWSRFSWWVV